MIYCEIVILSLQYFFVISSSGRAIFYGIPVNFPFCILSKSFLLILNLLSSIIGITAVIAVMVSFGGFSLGTGATTGCFAWHECSLSTATDVPSDSPCVPTNDTSTDDGESSQKEKEEKEKEKKSEYEDGLLGSLHSIPFESSVVRAYFHHHCAVLTCIIIDKPTQPPKNAG